MEKNLENEKWETIKDFEDYEVSNLGRVRNRKTGYELKQLGNGTGYLKVTLCKHGYSKAFFVHRLVAQAFIPNDDNLPEVDHKNFIRDDNKASNLAWISKADNLKHRQWSHPVIMMDREGNELRRFQYAVDAAEYIKQFNHESRVITIQMAICQTCRGYRPTAYGYRWKYEINSFSEKAQKDYWEQCEELKKETK